MARNPAPPEETKAPSVIREEISCWRSVVRFHPMGVLGARNPKTWRFVRMREETRRGGRAFKNPGMACNPPMSPKSSPYWKAPKMTTAFAKKTRRFAEMVNFASLLLEDVVDIVKKFYLLSLSKKKKSPFDFENKGLEMCLEVVMRVYKAPQVT